MAVLPRVVLDEERGQLIRDGYCLIPSVLNAALVEKTKAVIDAIVAGISAEHRAAQRSTGSMVGTEASVELADLIACPESLRVLDELGLEDVKFWAGYIISKPPRSPRLFWHQDCIMWDEPRAYSGLPPMVFAMYYLHNTTRENGCLRVIPGSHRKPHKLHEYTGWSHTPELQKMEDPEALEFATFPEEVEVPARVGDLIIGDARMFHASHDNSSDGERTVITLWYTPGYHGLQEATQAMLKDEYVKRHGEWPIEAQARLGSLRPDYDGPAEPLKWNRIPGAGVWEIA